MKKSDLKRYAITGIMGRLNLFIEKANLFLWCRENDNGDDIICHEDYYNDPKAIIPCVKICIPMDANNKKITAMIILTIVRAPAKGADEEEDWLRMELVMALKKPSGKQNDETSKITPEEEENFLATLKKTCEAIAAMEYKDKKELRRQVNEMLIERKTPLQCFERLVDKELPALKIKVSCVDEKKKLYRGSVVAFFEGPVEFMKYLDNLELRMTVAYGTGLLAPLPKKDIDKYF